MFSSLTIYDRRERALVGAADAALGATSALLRPFRRRTRPEAPQRILLLRLERIGDLVMALPAIRDVRTFAPAATIDLVVGSWNLGIAKALPYIDRAETVDAAWLARGGDGGGAQAMARAVRRWRSHRYDLAINFEPDIRSNLLMAASGARWTAGWTSGGGGPLLDLGLEYDAARHTTFNARGLVARVFSGSAAESTLPLLVVPDAARAAAAARLAGASKDGPLVGVHVSGGRLVKQWEPARFAEVANRLAAGQNATIVLTGSRADRPMIDEVRSALPVDRVLDAGGDVDLLELAALLAELDVLITGDTGPMHIAAAVGTPVVAVFGPSDPARYAPSGPSDRIVRAGIPCSPCNRIRRPPAHCVGHIPECLTSVTPSQVHAAALSSLQSSGWRRRNANHATA